ncbi:MAG: twin-arginine translocase TatA/TatE family subunit [Actinomycetota bacterium]
MVQNLFEGWHLIIVLLVVLLLFGSKRLPDIGRSLGKGIKEFKSGIHGMADDVREGMGEEKSAGQTAPESKVNKTE